MAGQLNGRPMPMTVRQLRKLLFNVEEQEALVLIGDYSDLFVIDTIEIEYEHHMPEDYHEQYGATRTCVMLRSSWPAIQSAVLCEEYVTDLQPMWTKDALDRMIHHLTELRERGGA